MSSSHDLYAVVDLGSNSFRLEVARPEGNRLISLLYRKETVRLGGGFAPDGSLLPQTKDKALLALKRFRECLANVPPERILAVGTHAMRRAAQDLSFREAANRALGVPVEIISGEREATLAFSGAVRSLPYDEHRRIVVDIGGGSTELAAGHGVSIETCASYPIGCVSASIGYFPEGKVTREAQRVALAQAERILAPARERFGNSDGAKAYMTAGTFRAVAEACRSLGWTKDEVRPEHIEALIERLISSSNASTPFVEALPGLRAERCEVIAGGLTVLQAIYRVLGLTEARLAQGGVRVGLLYELLGNPPYRDEREISLSAFLDRMSIDRTQAERVTRWTERLMALSLPHADETLLRRLRMAASLYELGITQTGHDAPRLAAQLLRSWHLEGFSRTDRYEAANFIQWQKGPLPEDPRPDVRNSFWRALLALRLAVIFLQTRVEPSFPNMRYDEEENAWHLPRAWLARHPLLDDALREEERRWHDAGVSLTFSRN